MNTCNTCEHAIFDEKWGEYKCEVYAIVLYDNLRQTIITDCENYKNGTPKESKTNADYKADLYDC